MAQLRGFHIYLTFLQRGWSYKRRTQRRVLNKLSIWALWTGISISCSGALILIHCVINYIRIMNSLIKTTTWWRMVGTASILFIDKTLWKSKSIWNQNFPWTESFTISQNCNHMYSLCTQTHSDASAAYLYSSWRSGIWVEGRSFYIKNFSLYVSELNK